MSEAADRYDVVVAGFDTRLAGIPADAWQTLTPCGEWTVEDLVAHVVGTQQRVLARLDDSEPPDSAANLADLPGAWRQASAAVASAVRDPARASMTVSGMFGEQPFERLVGNLLCTDTLVHTWDLARATGQDERLDLDAVAKAYEFLGPADEAIRRPGGFAPKIEPAPDADAQTAFLNFCGRSR